MKAGEKTGEVVGALSVRETDELMLITNKGQMVRTRVREIRETGRNTMGVKLMDLRNGEKLQAIAPVVSQVEEEEVKPPTRPRENPDPKGAKPAGSPVRMPVLFGRHPARLPNPNDRLLVAAAAHMSRCCRSSVGGGGTAVTVV